MSSPGAATLLLTAEHASPAVPDGVWLGVDEAVILGHRGWDPGSAEAAQLLQRLTGAPLFLGGINRLVVDLNRREEHAQVVPEVSFGVRVPGNEGLSDVDRARRIARWHRPWRRQVAAAVAERARPGRACLHLSVHSFSPEPDPARRTYDLGLLFDPSRPLERAWAARLGRELAARGLDVRDNEPYRGTDEGLTRWLRERHPDPAYAGLEIELSQRLCRAEQARVVECLVPLLLEAAPSGRPAT
jgi:predicted N-formylglutamate amidohydrolase